MATAKVRKSQSEKNKEIYEWYKSHNICTCCRREKVTDGKVLCKMCRRDRAEYVKLYYLDHADKKKAYAKQRREYYKANHLCQSCAKPLPDGHTKIWCESCSAKYRANTKRKRLREKWG